MKKPTLRSLKKKAWKLCSEYVRRREADEGGFVHCYTCGAPIHWKYEAQAGHSIPGRHNAVLLDDSICRPQCYACNCGKNGQHHIFATKLIKENGLQWWEQKLEGSRRALKLTREDWELAIENFKQRLEQLEVR